ncbi:hypothetical protein DINM_003016 [Dirofilaria immitis]|nr:hypothetical protein [Dirofilaria immitis]
MDQRIELNSKMEMQATTSYSPTIDQQHTFVVEDLEGRIRDSVKQSSVKSDESRTSMQNISNSLEPARRKTIQYVEDYLGINNLTVQATECFTDAISAACNSVDATIKNTYALLAKVEEVNEAMTGIRNLSQQVKDIKRVVDLFEMQLVTNSTT